MDFEVHAIPEEVLERARKESAGPRRPEFARMVAEGGEAVRCCLRDARPGEELVLFTYEPPIPPSPYREMGAVFAHREPCGGVAGDGCPAEWRGRPQVLRAYDRRGWIHPATRVHDGTDPEGALAAVFADQDVVQVHSRNVAYGCFMFAATRVPAP
ncbi:hypothetical protein Acy02nite_03930 [Actinoplanes cyaneus]|uniref:DUF1203 domain-containing protein n=1 Tax=Actinoplanes cyaneus TaxID=52696 RepID=A0A919M1K6_9ACTN|nr:DUF1203 domain-containing protein [Actinoplanes cyaneus]MCW2136119.1 Protein of unknown function (DUF1203) [Actinoplanes cyaneus]GID62512.1 hypothetical protein Acy02nite_03930 [Actinoplanes cyaneus]